MRVLLLTPSPPRPQAPSAVPLVAWAQLAALRERHTVTVVCTAGPDPAEHAAVEQLRTAGIDVHVQARSEPNAAARGRRWLGHAARWARGGRPMYTIWYYEPGLQRQLDRLLAERKFDAVNVVDSAMGAYVLRTTARTRLVEVEVRVPRPVDWRGWMRGNWYRGVLDELDWHRWPEYQRAIWRRFEQIEVFSARDAVALAEIAPEATPRVRVNPFGIDIPPAADPTREEEGTVVFVGSYTHAPNVDAARWLALEIMPRLRDQWPGVRLRLVGEDPRGALHGLANADVEVCGWAPAIEPVLERAAVVAAPVRIGGGQRMKVLQAMALGKAVVTTPRGAEGVLHGAGDSPVAVGATAVEIADALATLLADRTARRALATRARAAAIESHSVAAYGTRLHDALDALCMDRRAGRAGFAGAHR